MQVLIVGSFEIKKGIEYSGFVPLGNAVRLTENVRVSINRTPFINVPLGMDLYTLVDFTYTFEEDTAIMLTRVVEDDLSTIWLHECKDEVSIYQDTETDICAVTTGTDDTNIGYVSGSAMLENTAFFSQDVIIRVYDDATLLYTVTKSVDGNTTESVAFGFSVDDPILAISDVKFSLEPSTDMTVKGLQASSKIQVQRIS